MRRQRQLCFYPRKCIFPADTQCRGRGHRWRRRQLHCCLHRLNPQRQECAGGPLPRRSDLGVCLHQQRRHAKPPSRTDRMNSGKRIFPLRKERQRSKEPHGGVSDCSPTQARQSCAQRGVNYIVCQYFRFLENHGCSLFAHPDVCGDFLCFATCTGFQPTCIKKSLANTFQCSSYIYNAIAIIV